MDSSIAQGSRIPAVCVFPARRRLFVAYCFFCARTIFFLLVKARIKTVMNSQSSGSKVADLQSGGQKVAQTLQSDLKRLWYGFVYLVVAIFAISVVAQLKYLVFDQKTFTVSEVACQDVADENGEFHCVISSQETSFLRTQYVRTDETPPKVGDTKKLLLLNNKWMQFAFGQNKNKLMYPSTGWNNFVIQVFVLSFLVSYVIKTRSHPTRAAA